MSLVRLHKVCSRTFIVFMISFDDFPEVAKETALSLANSRRTGLASAAFVQNNEARTASCAQLNGLCKFCVRVKKLHGFIYPRFIRDTDQINGLFQFGLLGKRSRPCFTVDSRNGTSTSNVRPLS